MADRAPDFRTIGEAWTQCTEALALDGEPPPSLVMQAVFNAGAAAALSLAYHYGFVEIRYDLERAARKETPDGD